MWRARLAACVVGLLATSAAAQHYALAVGENVGLPSDQPLRYATQDAARVLRTLVELGQVPQANATLVQGATPDQLRAALATLDGAIRRAPTGRAERVTIYVSSHGSEGALHLAGAALPMTELVSFAKQAPADVVVVVVDACRSGSVTQLKGLKRTGERPTQVDAVSLEGRVFISASGDDEYAQESEALGGSYFTHHLVVGLRGAADASRDGRVTLDEAYRWAWSRTVESTFGSRAGVQRPAFHVDLHGQGELVLTELARATARLTLAAPPGAQWLVTDVTAGVVVGELASGGEPVTLAMAPGRYVVRLREPAGQAELTVGLEPGQSRALSAQDFPKGALTKVAVKGRDVPIFVLSLGAALGLPLSWSLAPELGGEARLRLDSNDGRLVNQLGFFVAGRSAASERFLFRFHELELGVSAAHRLDVGRFSLALGPQLSGVLVFQDQLPTGQPRLSLGPGLTAWAEGRLKLVASLEAFLSVHGGVSLFRRAELVALPRAGATLGVAGAW